MDKKNKKKLIVDRYENGIYPHSVLYVAKHATYDNLKNKFNVTKEDFDGSFDACLLSGLTNKDKKESCFLVLLEDDLLKRDAAYKIGACAHEALHYTINLTEYIEMKMNRTTGEACCYLTEWATKCIYNTLVK